MAILRNVEVFAPGHWYPSNGPKKGVKFTSEDIKEILKNTQEFIKKRIIRTALKVGHSTNQILKGQTDGDPSLGYPDNFRLKGGKIIADFFDLPEILRKAIKNKRFKSVSVEIFRNKIGRYIKNISILGADLPAVKTLKDLEAYLSEKTETIDENFNFAITWDESAGQHRARVRNPDHFRSDTFRTKDLEGVNGIQIIVGRLKPEFVPEGNDPNSVVVQAYRFNNEIWSLAAAQKWMADNTNFTANDIDKLDFIEFQFAEPIFDNEIFEFSESQTKIIHKGNNMPDEKTLELQAAKLEIEKEKLQKKLKEANDDVIRFKKESENKTELETKLKEVNEELTKFKSLNDEKIALETKNKELEDKIKAQDAKELDFIFTQEKTKILADFQADVKAGKLPPAMLEEIEKHLDEQKTNFSKDSGLTISPQLTKKVGLAYAEALPEGEQGNDDVPKPGENDEDIVKFGNVTDEIDFETKKLQAQNSNLTYQEASDLVFTLKPKLGEAYKKWNMTFIDQPIMQGA